MSSGFTVDPRSGVPIYLQVVEQVKRGVALGTLAPGDRLPTVKALALELTVNPNTVARAYRDLERERVIETSPGRGSFVRTSDDGVAVGRRAANDVAAAACDEAVRAMRAYGLDATEAREALAAAVRRWYPENEKETTA